MFLAVCSPILPFPQTFRAGGSQLAQRAESDHGASQCIMLLNADVVESRMQVARSVLG